MIFVGQSRRVSRLPERCRKTERESPSGLGRHLDPAGLASVPRGPRPFRRLVNSFEMACCTSSVIGEDRTSSCLSGPCCTNWQVGKVESSGHGDRSYCPIPLRLAQMPGLRRADSNLQLKNSSKVRFRAEGPLSPAIAFGDAQQPNRSLTYSLCAAMVNLDGMIVVASGTTPVVARWSGLLRKSGIQYAVTQSLDEEGVRQPSHSEIWVEEEDVEKARDVLINSGKGATSMLW